MNCRWICLCCTATAMASPALHAADKLSFNLEQLRTQAREALHAAADSPFKREELHALIREVAAKIEEKYKGLHPEADGLVQRVEETLAMPEPPKSNDADHQLMLAKELIAMSLTAGFKSSIGDIRGPMFDSSDTGYMQHYQDLESASTRDAEEVWRWLEMADAAQHLKWQDKAELCSQRVLGAARGLISREPKNAAAHALLGLALEWSGEKLTALQTALKLDPKQPLALHELLERRIHQSLEEAVLRQAISLEEKPKTWNEVARALYDRPLTEDETLAFEHQQKDLRHELVQLLTLAQKRRDVTVYLKSVNLLSGLGQQHASVGLAAKRGPEENFELFQARLRTLQLSHFFTKLADDSLLRTALELAVGDPEATGAIIIMALAGDNMQVAQHQQRPKEPRMEIIRETFTRLLLRAGADDTLKAARAAEAAFMMEIGLMLPLQRKPGHLDLLLRAVHLDPFRQRTQHALMGLCFGMLRESKVTTAAAALTLTELALLPNVLTRRTCAAAAASLHDWPAAQRYLDACLREKPDDLGLLNQKAVTLLRESQSRASQKKAEIYFHKIAALRDKQTAASEQDKDDLKLIARNHILFLMIGGKNATAREELAMTRRDKTLDEKECLELEKLLP